MSTEPKMYVADTENTVPRARLYEFDDDAARNADNTDHTIEALNEIEKQRRTRVWAAAVAPVKADPVDEDVTIVNSMESFIFTLSQLPSASEVYFHNLAYDGALIISHLLTTGYYMDEEPEEYDGKTPYQFLKPYRGGIKALISGDGAYYQITVTFKNNGRSVTLKDSLKIIPFSVDAIGASFKTKAKKLTGGIDYTEIRPHGHKITEEERKYIANDVLVMSEALHRIHTGEVDLTRSLTIGAACMSQFEETANPDTAGEVRTVGAAVVKESKNPRTAALMPQLSLSLDADLRKAYRGGFCYVNRHNPLIDDNQVVDARGSSVKGNTYDVNSLYPSVMVDKPMPVGQPHIFTGADALSRFNFKGGEPYFIRFTADFTVKRDHVPFIQLKGNSLFAENEYVRSTNGEPEELTLTGVDFLMFLDHYDIHTLQVDKVWVFSFVTDLFNDYIHYWTHVKETADNPVDYMIAKLMLNNLYGKMAQSSVREVGVPYLDEEGILRYHAVEEEGMGGYIPIGAYVTAYAREVTVRAAQANYDNFLYCDTDSIHIIGEARGVDVGPHLGQWDHEATWDMARFVRQKTYMERVIAEERKNAEGVKVFGPVEPYVTVKAAGANALVKDRLQREVARFDSASGEWVFSRLDKDERDEYTAEVRDVDEVFERFTYGLKEAGKLSKQSVRGGSWLRETTWSITPPVGVYVDPVTGLAPTRWSVID